MTDLDRFRNRKPQTVADGAFDSEELITTIFHKSNTEEIRILTTTKGHRHFVCIKTLKRDGDSWLISRSITISMSQIESILDGLDKVSIHYISLAGAPEEALPAFPLSYGGSENILVKLDRYNGNFNIKITMKFGKDWAMLYPEDIEDMITALVEAHDRIKAISSEESNLEDPIF